jgi:hypothetical protein
MNLIPPQLYPREQASEANTYLLQVGWSDWVKAIVPLAAQQPGFYIQRPNGLRRESQEILSNVPGLHYEAAYGCGIFEWSARKIESRNETKVVVYIGSTCQAYPGSSLRDRITEYCTNGSNKADLMNDALTRGYELWVRVKGTENRETAEDLENELLDRYDYAWNVRRNGELRHIFP